MNDEENPITLTRAELLDMFNDCVSNRDNIDQNYHIRDITDKTPLLFAIEAQDIDIVKRLIAMGVNLCHQGNKPYSPLCRAIQGNNFELVKYLVDIGANTCYPGREGRTPLYHAIQGRNLDIIRLLLENGARFNVTFGLITAIDEGEVKIAKELLSYNPDVEWVYQDLTPLLRAIARGNWEMVELLVQHRAKVEGDGQCWATPLQMAVISKHIDIVKYLLGKDAKVNQTTTSITSTPVQLALRDREFEIFKVLIDAGALTTVREVRGQLWYTEGITNRFVRYLMEARP